MVKLMEFMNMNSLALVDLAQLTLDGLNKDFMKKAHIKGTFKFDYYRDFPQLNNCSFYFYYDRDKESAKQGGATIVWDYNKKAFTELYITFPGENYISLYNKNILYLTYSYRPEPSKYLDKWRFDLIGDPEAIKNFNKKYKSLCNELKIK